MENVPTHANKSLSVSNPTKDAAAKEIFKDAQIESLLLYEIFPSTLSGRTRQFIFRQLALQTITTIAVPEADPIQLPEASSVIETNDSESHDHNGMVRYDTNFQYRESHMRIFFIVEMQNVFDLYDLTGQLFGYSSHQVSDQKGKAYFNDDYDNVCPMRQLWILPHAKVPSQIVRLNYKALLQLYHSTPLFDTLSRDIAEKSEIVLAFLNQDDDYEEKYKGTPIEALGQIFLNNGRDEAIHFLEEQKGITMHESLKQSLKDYRFCNIPSQQEFDKIANAYSVLQAEKADLQAENAGLRAEKADWQTENDELRMKNESLEQQMALLTRQLSFYQKNS